MENLPSSRAEALRLGSKTYFTGKPCKNGHIDKRRLPSGSCSVCMQEASRNWAKRNPNAMRASVRKWRRKNGKGYYAVWNENNRDRLSEYSKKYRKANLETFAAKTALRRARKLQATPPWLNDAHRAEIAKFYEGARFLGLHVDHRWALRGKRWSGLHVPWNLRLMTRENNVAKGNRAP